MDDWSAVTIRFALYTVLGIGFGLPLQRLAMAGHVSRIGLASTALVGIGLSALSLLALVAAMAGSPLLPVDRETFAIVVTETPVGTAFLVRFAALACLVSVACWPGPASRARLLAATACAAVALGTLAWGGHGAMDEGARGTLHLAADIVHLLAAGAWIGAIAALLLSIAGPGRAPDAAGRTHRALERFARTGSIVVALLLVTGLVSGAMILGPDGATRLGATLYGRILLVKLALFVAMLGMAGLNRWVLTPRLGGAQPQGRMIGISLSVELAAGLAVLAAVSWLGTLSPEG